MLSGFAEVRAVARAATIAHRFVAKPCDPEELAGVIERSCALAERTRAEGLLRAATRATDLPLAPETHSRLGALLCEGTATLAEASAIVEQDIALSGRVLQLANSAFFSRGRPVSGLHEAVKSVGLQTLSALTLTATARDLGDSIAAVQAHGAMLQDIGLLILATEEPEYLADVLAAAELEGRPAVDIEYERRGISHAEIGAHLLALWGLPPELVEAVAFHHRLVRC